MKYNWLIFILWLLNGLCFAWYMQNLKAGLFMLSITILAFYIEAHFKGRV